jgi:hypothetical protein
MNWKENNQLLLSHKKILCRERGHFKYYANSRIHGSFVYSVIEYGNES